MAHQVKAWLSCSGGTSTAGIQVQITAMPFAVHGQASLQVSLVLISVRFSFVILLSSEGTEVLNDAP